MIINLNKYKINLNKYKNEWYFGKNELEHWYFGKNEFEHVTLSDKRKIYAKFNVLSALKPGEVFILEYNNTIGNTTEYALMKRTKYRQWNFLKEEYEYVQGDLHMYNLENFYQNFFGINSTKVFESIDDPELNLVTNIHFGKYASKLPII